MSERAFFSFRYSTPGFSFILGFLLWNPSLLIYLILISNLEPVSGIILSILTLASGSALGLLLSQFWFFYWQRMRNGLYGNPMNELFTLLFRKFNISFENKEICPQRKIVFFDYLFHYLFYATNGNSHKQYEKIRNYLDRRWDLYHTIGSSIVSLWLGSLAGVAGHFWVFSTISKVSIILSTNMVIFPVYFVLLCIALLSVTLVCVLGCKWIMEQYLLMKKALVRSLNTREFEYTMKKAFPDFF